MGVRVMYFRPPPSMNTNKIKSLIVHGCTGRNFTTDSSRYYVISNVASITLCRIPKLDLGQFKQFIIAVSRITTLNLTTSSANRTCAKLFSLFVFVHVLHQSSAVHYITNRRLHLNLPSFIFSFLVSICMEVQSRNVLGGYSNGEVTISDDWQGIISSIDAVLTDKESLQVLFEGTPFQNLTASRNIRSLQESIRSEFVWEIDPETGYPYESIIERLADLEACFLNTGKGPLPMFSGYIDISVSNKLGIYRFRKASKDIYIAQQRSLAPLDNDATNYLFCFLKLFSPEFYTFDGSDAKSASLNSSSLLSAGEGLFVLTDTSRVDAWLNYLGATVNKGSQGTGNYHSAIGTQDEQSTNIGEALLKRSFNGNVITLSRRKIPIIVYYNDSFIYRNLNMRSMPTLVYKTITCSQGGT